MASSEPPFEVASGRPDPSSPISPKPGCAQDGPQNQEPHCLYDRALSRLAHIGLYIGGIDCSLEQVRAGRYKNNNNASLTADALAAETDEKRQKILETHVASLESSTKARYDRVESKLKTLLSAHGIAFAMIGWFSLTGKPIVLIAVLPVFLSTLVELKAFEVREHHLPTLNAEELRDTEKLWSRVLHDRMRASAHNEDVIDFVVDCYRAAHRLFFWGLAAVFIVGLVVVWRAEAPETRVRIQNIEAPALNALRELQPSSTSPTSSSSPLGGPAAGDAAAEVCTPGAAPDVGGDEAR